MESDLVSIFAALEGAGVKYLVVGGVAVVLHGHLRVTADVDLVVKLDDANALAAMKALGALGFRPRAPVPIEQFADAAVRKVLWSPNMPGTEVDLFVAEPFDFDATFARAIRAPLEGTTVSVIALDDLLVLKRAAGRDKDREDVRALEALRDAEKH